MRNSFNAAGVGRVFRRAAAAFLIFATCIQLGVMPASAASDTGSNGTMDIWRWERVDSQDDLPTSSGKWYENGIEEGYAHPVLLLYEFNGGKYMIDGDYRTSGDKFKFKLCGLWDGVAYGEKSFRTVENISHMTMRYVGTDSDNGDAKQYRFRLESDQDDSGVVSNLYMKSDYYFQSKKETGEYTNITVLTPNTISSAKVNSGRVKMFVNIGWEKDAMIRIDSKTGNVYPERSVTWSMGEFVMYVGYKERISVIRSDSTIGSGQVANYNGRVYIMPGVTITIESGGVLSVSGELYNNGSIMNSGDIVVQKGGSIEQFCLGDSPGGVICCDGGDLVILSGGCVITGKTETYSDYTTGYGNGFVMRNGATCTNFGVLAVGSTAYVVSGATLDNRSSGTMLFGYKPKTAYRGAIGLLDAKTAASTSVYDNLSVYNETTGMVSNPRLLYIGKNVLLSNDGTVCLGLWAMELPLSGSDEKSGVSATGSGKIYINTWAEAVASKYIWIPYPTGWSKTAVE